MIRLPYFVLFVGLATLASADPETLSMQQAQAVSTAFEGVLIDHKSAELSDLKSATSANGTLSVCGYINAKNRFGGYTGKLPFFGSFRGEAFELRTVGQDRDTLHQVMNRCQMFGIWQ